MEEKKKFAYEKPELVDFKKTGAFGGVGDGCSPGSSPDDGQCLDGSDAAMCSEGSGHVG